LPAIRQENILLHHPIDSFSSVIDFLNASARDPQCSPLKQTLYASDPTRQLSRLCWKPRNAANKWLCSVELKARFDEESNMAGRANWNRRAFMLYNGLVGLKTHSKIGMVVRQEADGIRRYFIWQLATTTPSRPTFMKILVSLLAMKPSGQMRPICSIFLTGYSTQRDYRKLFVAPLNLRQKLVRLDPA